MDKGNVNKHRYSMSGLKVKETEKWGRDKAAQRYGELKQSNTKPADASQPQFKNDQASDRSFNAVANDWRRGFNSNGRETAEGKPGYVRGYRGK